MNHTFHRRQQVRRIKCGVAIVCLVAATTVVTPLYSQQQVEQAKKDVGREDNVKPGPPQCVWVAAWGDWSDRRDPLVKDRSHTGSLKELKGEFAYQGKEKVPGCFGNFWKPLCTGRTFSGQVLTDAGGSFERDGSIVRYGVCDVGQLVWPDSGALKLADFLGVPPSARIELTYDNQKSYVIPNEKWWDFDLHRKRSMTWGMDSQCRYVPLTSSTYLCGFAGVSWSPISLILDESTSLDADMTVVEFSLDINQPNSYSLWKGSDKAPLLVYDPTQSRDVTNATRLFGNYTFGGRTAELSRVRLDSRPERSAWKNGYEALALLDTNRDDKIAGAELESLALWFDTNRNAHSEAGEVRSLASVGIIALYYKNPSGQVGSKDIGISIGYERVVDGRVVQGRSVDWYGETFSSKVEAAQALGAMLSGHGPASL